MTSDSSDDLLDGLRADGIEPADFWPAVPGLEHLLRTLASGPAADELAGEQAALAMFRAHVRPPAAAPASAAESTQALPATAQPGGTRQMRRRVIPAWRPLRLAALTTAVLVGGFTAAAYAAVLPAPVQRIAYQALHYIGVPDVQHAQGSARTGSGSSPVSPGGHASPRPSPPNTHPAGPSHGKQASPTPSARTSPSPSVSASPSAGPLALTAQAAASKIQAGSAATVDGVLTAGGKPLAGITVRLMEHVAGRPGWQVAGTSATSRSGAVAITVQALGTTARFLLASSDGADSPVVRITVVPSVTFSIKLGARGIRDYVLARTAYAQPGDTVLLQVLRSGVWVTWQVGTLGSAGNAVFVLDAQRAQGKVIRVVLLATVLHARAVSLPQRVPPPA